MNDSCSRIHKNSGVFGAVPKSHDFGYAIGSRFSRLQIVHVVALRPERFRESREISRHASGSPSNRGLVPGG